MGSLGSLCCLSRTPSQSRPHGTGDDTVDPSSAILQFTIPSSVLAALAVTGDGTLTVNNLLNLANLALAGHDTGGASSPDITAAVDAINRGFDNCRFLVPCPVATVFKTNSARQTLARAVPSDGFSTYGSFLSLFRGATISVDAELVRLYWGF